MTQAGCAVPAESRWCDQLDGRLTVVLPAPADAEQRRLVEGVLGGYAVDWHLVDPVPEPRPTGAIRSA